MRIPYVKVPTTQPIVSLRGADYRFRPDVEIAVVGPKQTLYRKAILDSGSDDTIFPASWALLLGVDLANAPVGEADTASGDKFLYRYAEVGLQVTADGDELFTWRAIVGFSDARKTRGLLGHAGMMEFFDLAFFGERREVILTPNSAFPGIWKIRRRRP